MASDEPLGAPALAPALRALEPEYEFLREVGRGGMAAVYLARARASGRVVAIKTVAAHRAHDPEAVARFEREARTVLALDHPNIVRSYSVEQLEDGALAIVMQHAAGGTLREALREAQRAGESFSPERVARVLGDVAAALGHAHERGVVHRDVKPENIFLDPRNGRALLSDFGIARNLEGDNALTMTGSAIGTPTYMSPEQIDGRRVDGRSDLYALGLVGWEMLAGARPWEGDSLYTVIYKQKHEALAPLAELRPDTPLALRDAIERALRKEPGERWPDAYAFEEAVRVTLPASSVPADFERSAETATTSTPTADAPLGDAAVPTAMNDGSASIDARPASGDVLPAAAASADVEATPAAAGAPAAASAGEAPAAPAADTEVILTPSSLPSPLLPDEPPRIVPGPPRRGGPYGPRRTALRLAVPLTLAVVAALAAREGARARRARGAPAPDSATTAVTLPAGGEVVTAAGESVSAPTPATASTTTTGTATTASNRTPGAAVASPAVKTSPPATTTASAPVARAPVGLARFAVTHGDSLALCRSPAARDQRACFTAVLTDRDAPLNAAYGELVRELRRRDPAGIGRLRADELRWLAERDADCARAGRGREGALWAASRAACLGDAADRRAADLRGRLEQLRSR